MQNASSLNKRHYFCCLVLNLDNHKLTVMKRICLLLVICSLIANMARAQMTTRVIRDSLFIPWELVYGADSNIWFTQKNGYICRLEPKSGHIDTLYHETNTVMQNEGGMLGLALDPNFLTDPYVYVAYNYTSGTYKERIVKYTYAANTLNNPQILLDDIAAASIHNGCRLVIVGDKLYITTGDASNQPSAQNIASVNGKVLRINLDGSIPSDNPIAGSPVWSWGHRNAQGLVYANGKLYSSEHGPSTDDEINIIEKGRNYGWPTVHGFCNTPTEITFCNDSNVIDPIRAWTPTIAVCGIDYYNHLMFPSLQNSILMTTLKDSKLYQLQLNSAFDSITSATVISGVSFNRLRSICIGPYGNIFIGTSNSNSNGSNRIDKIVEIYDPSFVPPVGVSMQTDNGVTIYPNPTKDKFTVKVDAAQKLPMQYSLTSRDGKVLMKGVFELRINTIAADRLPTGIYMLNVKNKQEIISSYKLIKE